MKILVTNCKVFNSDKTSLYIEDDKFVNPFEIDDTVVVKDVKGNMVFPGFVDLHCHLREPGFEYKETIKTGTMSAAKGGYTSVCSMPNTFPVCDNASVVHGIMKKAKEAGFCRVYPVGACSKGEAGKELSEMGLMKEAGIVAVTDDGKCIATAELLRKVMEYSSDFGLLVMDHCEDASLSDGSMNESDTSTSIGLRGIPSVAEDIIIARDIIMSEYLGIPIHICHVSTKNGVRMIREAKKRGVKVTTETCPHYFTLNDENCVNYDSNFKMYPPLRENEDVNAIIEGLADGTIDCIATDHAPHHEDEKTIEFALANNGIVGLETAFPLGYTYLVKTNRITLNQLIDAMVYNPSSILKLGRGSLEVGADADFTVMDLDNEFVFDKSKMLCKSKNTPYDGYKLFGKTILTVMGGRITYEELC